MPCYPAHLCDKECRGTQRGREVSMPCYPAHLCDSPSWGPLWRKDLPCVKRLRPSRVSFTTLFCPIFLRKSSPINGWGLRHKMGFGRFVSKTHRICVCVYLQSRFSLEEWWGCVWGIPTGETGLKRTSPGATRHPLPRGTSDDVCMVLADTPVSSSNPVAQSAVPKSPFEGGGA